jgi:glycosyltransferase involved in cell wall biosynthesis
MKVLHVIPGISKGEGGPSQAIFPMCQALSVGGVDLLLATTDDGLLATTDDGLSGANRNGKLLYGQISDYKGQPTIFFPSQLGNSFKYSRPFARWLNSNVANYDLVHIHAVFNHACIAAARACRKHDVPYIVRPLGSLDPWSMKQKSWRKKVFWHGGIKRMLNSAAAVQYTAKAEQEATERLLALNHGIVIPLGVDVHLTREAVATEGFSQDSPPAPPYVLVLSRLLPTKGLDLLLEAFLSVRNQKRLENWRLVLAGEGPAKFVTRLKELTAAANASKHVLFPGWLEGENKRAALHHASLLALPSYHENFGLCVLEALACGVPVLVSPHVNLAPQVQAAGAGWVAAIDKTSLAAALTSAMASEAERLRRGEAGRALARSFTWPAVAGMLTGLYREILASRN